MQVLLGSNSVSLGVAKLKCPEKASLRTCPCTRLFVMSPGLPAFHVDRRACKACLHTCLHAHVYTFMYVHMSAQEKMSALEARNASRLQAWPKPSIEHSMERSMEFEGAFEGAFDGMFDEHSMETSEVCPRAATPRALCGEAFDGMASDGSLHGTFDSPFDGVSGGMFDRAYDGTFDRSRGCRNGSEAAGMCRRRRRERPARGMSTPLSAAITI